MDVVKTQYCLWISHTSVPLESRSNYCLCARIFFQGCLIVDRLGKYFYIMSYSKTNDRYACSPLLRIHIFPAPPKQVVSCNTAQCMYNYHPALCVVLWELVLRKSSSKNADILAFGIGVSDKVLCIWLESYLFQQTYNYGRLKVSLQTW